MHNGSFKGFSRHWTLLVLGIVVVSMVLGGVWWAWWGSEAEKFPHRDPVTVEAEPVKVGAVTRRAHVNGVLTASQSVTILPEIEGKISKIVFQQGEEVGKGDVLIQLEDQLYKAHLQKALARSSLTKVEHERAKKLFHHKFGPQVAVDKTLAELKDAEAEVQIARARLEQTIIRAPFDGIVGLKNVSEGSAVSRNQELLALVSLDPLYVDFFVPDSFLKHLKVGDIVDVTVEGFDSLPMESKIIALSPQADKATHGIQVRSELSNPTGEMKPGHFAQVTLNLGKETDALLIPIVAVEKEGDTNYVYTVIDRVAVYTEVTLGLREGGMVQVKDGLKKGDVVVSVGQMKLQDGVSVRLVSEDMKKSDLRSPNPPTQGKNSWMARLWGE